MPRVRRRPELIASAASFGTIPDLLNYWLTGELRAEFTMATTTQFVDARTRDWARGLLVGARHSDAAAAADHRAGLGAGGAQGRRLCGARGNTGRGAGVRTTPARPSPRSSPAADGVHQLWHMVAARHRAGRAGHHAARARFEFHERRRRVRDDAAAEEYRRLWLLQACRRSWARRRATNTATTGCCQPPAITNAAISVARSIPITAGFSSRRTWSRRFPTIAGRPASSIPDRRRRSRAASSRAWRSSTAWSSNALESLTGNRIDEIRIVGGGSRNRLLNQFTADATGCTVIAGPVEATALGNIAMQMLATGAVASLDEARANHRAIVPGRTIRTEAL